MLAVCYVALQRVLQLVCLRFRSTASNDLEIVVLPKHCRPAPGVEPGFLGHGREENRRRYLRRTNAAGNAKSVEGRTAMATCRMRPALRESEQNPQSRRSVSVNVARRRPRTRTMSCCLSTRFSAITARTPPGPLGFAAMTTRCSNGSRGLFMRESALVKRRTLRNVAQSGNHRENLRFETHTFDNSICAVQHNFSARHHEIVVMRVEFRGQHLDIDDAVLPQSAQRVAHENMLRPARAASNACCSDPPSSFSSARDPKRLREHCKPRFCAARRAFVPGS